MTSFEMQQLEQDARRLIVCTGCYGSGEDRWNEGRACPTCKGAGKSAAEPRVIELIERLRLVESQLLDASHSLSNTFHAERRVEQLETAIEKFVNQYPWQNSPEILELAALVEERDVEETV